MKKERKNKIIWNLSVGVTTGLLMAIIGTGFSAVTKFKADDHVVIVAVAVWIAELLTAYIICFVSAKLISKKSNQKFLNFGLILLCYNFSVIFVVFIIMCTKTQVIASYIDTFILIMQIVDLTYVIFKLSLMDRKEIANVFDKDKSDEEKAEIIASI